VLAVLAAVGLNALTSLADVPEGGRQAAAAPDADRQAAEEAGD